MCSIEDELNIDCGGIKACFSLFFNQELFCMNKWWNISNIMGDQTQPTFEMTPGFKPFTIIKQLLNSALKNYGDLLDLNNSSDDTKAELNNC